MRETLLAHLCYYFLVAAVVAVVVVVVIVVRRGRGVVVVVIVFYFESIHLSAQFSTIYEFRPSFTEFPAISHFPSSGQIERRFLFCQKPRLLTLGFSFFLSFFFFSFFYSLRERNKRKLEEDEIENGEEIEKKAK